MSSHYPLATIVLALSTLAAPLAQETRIASVNSEGDKADEDSSAQAVSADGSVAAFHSIADNLSTADGEGYDDVFVHDFRDGSTVLASQNELGVGGESLSLTPVLSGDGRYVAFLSAARLLVPGDNNGALDIFVRDNQTGVVTRVDVSSTGEQSNADSSRPSISADGRYVAFDSLATNLVPDDTNGSEDVFVHDRQTGETVRVSVASDGTQGNDFSRRPRISPDGRYVAFKSWASNLVAGDTNGYSDVFVHDRETGVTERVSISTAGDQGNTHSGGIGHSISRGGRYAIFASGATNLIPNDTNGRQDIFLRDRQTGETNRVSMAWDGTEPNQYSERCWISGDGRKVAFDSLATNLVPADLNNTWDVFVRDLDRGTIRLVSNSSDGEQGNNLSLLAMLSEDGEAVVYRGDGNNLVPDDFAFSDVFVTGPLSEVHGVRHAGLEAGVHRLTWEDATATSPLYNVHRGSLDVLRDDGIYDHEPVSNGCGVAVASLDLDDLLDGVDAYYLVTLVTVLGEGPYGFDSAQARRPRSLTPCP